MPYIITTRYSDCDFPESCGEGDISRTAVATLDEARETVYPLIHAAHPGAVNGNSDEQRAHRWDVVAAQKIGESGGTVGPLPDGTVIEVRHVDWIAMRTLAGRLPVRAHDKPAVLAAFNGTQS